MTDTTNTASYKTDKDVTIAVNQIAELIEFLFPDPSPNVFTLSDFLNRYKITGLGKRAITAIEQSQRINRNTGDADQLGLCEFYVGLIYLYSGDYRGAIKQFRIAPEKWNFSKSDLIFEAKALAHYAEGVGQQLVYHYEDALIAYTNAEHGLQRSLTWNPSQEKAKEFKEILSRYIKNQQNTIHKILWQVESSSPESTTAEQKDETREQEHQTKNQPFAKEEEGEKEPQVKEQLFEGKGKEKEDVPNDREPTKQAASDEEPNSIIRQFYTMPESAEYREHCKWYRVQQSNKDYLPLPEKGTILLVDHRIKNYTCHEDDLILVGTDDENVINPVTPLGKQLSPFEQIHITTPRLVGVFTRPLQKPITLHDVKEIPGRDAKIIGIVVGFWHYVNA